MPNLNIVLQKIKENDKPFALNFSRYNLDDSGVHAVLDALQENNKVVSLNFSGHIFTKDTAKKLGKLIGNLPNLKNLDLSNCQIPTIYNIRQGLRASKSVENINFENTYFPNYFKDSPISLLFNGISDSPSIRCINFKGRPLDAKVPAEATLIQDIINGLASDKCCIIEFYCDGADSLPEVKASLEKNRNRLEKEGKALPMDGIENNPEASNAILTEETTKGVFVDPLEAHGIFGKRAPKDASEVKAEKDKPQPF